MAITHLVVFFLAVKSLNRETGLVCPGDATAD